MTPDFASARAEMRSALRAKRRAFVADGKPGIPIPAQLSAAMTAARCVGGYHATAAEADVMPLLDWCQKHGIATALPAIPTRDALMGFKRWSPGDALDVAPFGFRQPPASAPDVNPDVILVPLVGFDARGNRLGQGAGHYDRYFSRHGDATRIGIAFSCQQVDAIASESWDVPLHAIVTETAWIGVLS